MSNEPDNTRDDARAVMLHVFPSFGYGGQQARFAALAKGLGEDFHHVVIALDDDLSARELVASNLTVDYQKLALRKSSTPNIANLFRLRKLLKEVQPDILCTYNWGAIETVAAMVISGRIKHIHFEDGFGPDETTQAQHKRRMLARRLLLRNSHVVVPSKVLEYTARKKWGVGAGRLHYIRNGVDYEKFQQPPTGLRTTTTVGSIGALRPEKNYALLVNAFLAADKPGKSSLKIIGEGPMRDSLAQAVKAADAVGRISLPGATATPEDVYRDFDIFALSSDTEQAPLTLMEAMAAGLPIIATNVGDIYEMVSLENRAFITPPGDVDTYALALTHLIQNPDARAVLGAANKQKAKAEFGLKAMIDKHRSLYNDVLRGA